MNKKQKRVRGSKISSRNLVLRNECWPDLDSNLLWDRHQRDGYTTMPRTMPLILQIMDHLAHKNKPVSQTYLSFWCRVFDEGIVEIKNENELAYEAGFTGQRAVNTWHSRMKNLIELGFIDAKPGPLSKYQLVLLYDPYMVIKKFKKQGKLTQALSFALLARANEIGAGEDLQ